MFNNRWFQKRIVIFVCLAVMLWANALAQSTNMAYQGYLRNSGVPANGTFNMVFRLYSVQAGGTPLQNFPAAGTVAVSVMNGLFTQALTYDVVHFTGADRWLEIVVNGTTLTPRVRLNATPHSVYSVKTGSLVLPFSQSGNQLGVLFNINNLITSGDGRAIQGETAADAGTGVVGKANSTTGFSIGVTGQSASNSGVGVMGLTTSSFGNTIGVRGQSNSASGMGVYGYATSTTGVNYGVYGQTASPTGFAGYFMGNGYFSGNVGIGITSPTAKLDVSGVVKMTGFLLPSGAGAGKVLMSDASGNGTWQNNSLTLPFEGTSNSASQPAFKVTSTAHDGIEARTSVSGRSGLFASNSSAAGIAWGVFGTTQSPNGYGVEGSAQATTGSGVGVLGSSSSSTGWGGFFTNRLGVGTSVSVPKFSVNVSDGDMIFTDPQGSITFPATTAENAPMIQMFASGASNANRMVIAHSSTFSNWGLQYRDSNDSFHFIRAGTSVLSIGNNIGVGVETPEARLHVRDGNLRLDNGEIQSWGSIDFHPDVDNSGDDNIRFLNSAGGEVMRVNSDGNVGIGTSSPDAKLRVIGTVKTDVLEISGAGDLAERFEILEEAEPGMVMEIDPDMPGRLRPTRSAYSPLVAGVISGANDLRAGVILDPNTSDGKSHPIALTGRVWVYCDATKTAIKPGSLLTSSDTPGYAMAVTEHGKAKGAVLGKAMSALPKGKKGLVLVLVGLQ
ncbi:MAG: hypothetical protein KIT45_04760 [Fimbriimonadia bacterium]|nr:hypothetical protein [Fimbriimonadia bacterium]